MLWEVVDGVANNVKWTNRAREIGSQMVLSEDDVPLRNVDTGLVIVLRRHREVGREKA